MVAGSVAADVGDYYGEAAGADALAVYVAGVCAAADQVGGVAAPAVSVVEEAAVSQAAQAGGSGSYVTFAIDGASGANGGAAKNG